MKKYKYTLGEPAPKKQHLYSTARIKGLHLCFVALLEYDELNDRYFVETPFTRKWFNADELEGFVL